MPREPLCDMRTLLVLWVFLLPHIGLHVRGDSSGHTSFFCTLEWGL